MDAWSDLGSVLAAAEHQLGARQLADGVGLVSNHQFYLASRRYAEQNGKVIKLIVEELARLDAWARQNFKDGRPASCPHRPAWTSTSCGWPPNAAHLRCAPAGRQGDCRTTAHC
ncbi:MAG: hypothetical protein U1E47_00100 [Rivihabitans pingtungensis]